MLFRSQLDYIAALVEIEESDSRHRLYEAISAMEQRMLSPPEPGSAEEAALRRAQRIIAELRDQYLYPPN